MDKFDDDDVCSKSSVEETFMAVMKRRMKKKDREAL